MWLILITILTVGVIAYVIIHDKKDTNKWEEYRTSIIVEENKRLDKFLLETPLYAIEILLNDGTSCRTVPTKHSWFIPYAGLRYKITSSQQELKGLLLQYPVSQLQDETGTIYPIRSIKSYKIVETEYFMRSYGDIYKKENI